MAIKGFKAYEKGMKCKGFQYEEWKEYQTLKLPSPISCHILSSLSLHEVEVEQLSFGPLLR